MKAVFHFSCGPWLTERLAEAGGDAVRFVAVAEGDDNRLGEEIADADMLCHVLQPVTAELMDAAPRLALIQKIGVGVNTIDLDAARARDIAVCNMPGTNTAAVAEMTLALMLATLRRTSGFEARIRTAGGWPAPADWRGGLGEIGGRTVGLVGFGAVPRRLAPVLEALGATVIYTGRGAHADTPYRYLDKATLLAEADIVSLHIPETPETVDWLDAGAIAAMKSGAILINTARGTLVDEEALAAALASGRLAGAGLDVFAREPAKPDHPLLSLETVTALPHVAWLTRETLERSLSVVLENCARLAAGRDLLHRVA